MRRPLERLGDRTPWQAPTKSRGGWLPPAEFAIVGGTGEYAGARGQVTSTREPSVRKLEYESTLDQP